MQALCKDGTMQVSEWIELAAKLDIDGLEWYAGFLEMRDEKNWSALQTPGGRSWLADSNDVLLTRFYASG